MVGIVVSCFRRAASKIHDFRGFIYLTTGKLWSGQQAVQRLQRRGKFVPYKIVPVTG